MYKDILKDSKENNKVIGLTLYGEDGFWSGIVKNYNEEIIMLQHYTKYGQPDGLLVESIENIESIDFNNEYSESMEYIILNSDKLNQDFSNIDISSKIENWPIDAIKEAKGNTNIILSIQINKDEIYYGFVEDINETNIKLKLIDQLGKVHKMSIFKIEDISTVKFNCLSSRRRLLLYQRK